MLYALSAEYAIITKHIILNIVQCDRFYILKVYYNDRWINLNEMTIVKTLWFPCPSFRR